MTGVRLRYSIYDPAQRVYLRRLERPTGDSAQTVTEWTRKPAQAMRFPGAKSAAAVARLLGCVVKNAKGEIIG